jgi:hypothetical protein
MNIKKDLELYREDMITTAIELLYPGSVIMQLVNAENSVQMVNIMTKARKGTGRGIVIKNSNKSHRFEVLFTPFEINILREKLNITGDAQLEGYIRSEILGLA